MLVGLMLTRPNGNVTNWKVKLKDKRHRIHFSSSFYCFWWNKQFWVKKSKSRKTKPCLATSPFKNETFFQLLLTSQLPNTNTVTWLVISTRNMARTRKRRGGRGGGRGKEMVTKWCHLQEVQIVREFVAASPNHEPNTMKKLRLVLLMEDKQAREWGHIQEVGGQTTGSCGVTAELMGLIEEKHRLNCYYWADL